MENAENLEVYPDMKIKSEKEDIKEDIKLEPGLDEHQVPSLSRQMCHLLGLQHTGSAIFEYDRVKNSFQPGAQRSFQDFYFDLRASRYKTLLRKGSGVKFNGADIDVDEKMTPTTECEIVLDWLEGIDERLPHFIEQKYAAELRTITLRDLQMEISEHLDEHLLELNAVNNFKNQNDAVFVECK